MKKEDLRVFALVNSADVLNKNLRRSPVLEKHSLPLVCLNGQSSASGAYYDVMKENPDGILCFVHQDVYLPGCWFSCLQAAIGHLDEADPNWAVLGCYGVRPDGTHVGRVWDSSWNRVFGHSFQSVERVVSVDELFFCVRAQATNLFDTQLPDFHLYGTDVVLNAQKNGGKSYVADIPIVHNSRSVVSLRGGYSKAYRYMQKKWKQQLPLYNTIVPVTRWGLPLYLKHLRLAKRYGFNSGRPAPSDYDPLEIERSLGWHEPNEFIGA
jgi:hypothetical protein